MNPNDRLRDALEASGLSMVRVAEELGVDPKTVERWLTIGRIPYPRHRTRLAALVSRSEHDLWPDAKPAGSLEGSWRSYWQTSDPVAAIAVQHIMVRARRDSLWLQAVDRGKASSEACCLWNAELRLLDHEALVGWYRSVDVAVRSHGALYLRLHPLGRIAAGRRVGLASDGGIYVGWAVLARDDDEGSALIGDLVTGPDRSLLGRSEHDQPEAWPLTGRVGSTGGVVAVGNGSLPVSTANGCSPTRQFLEPWGSWRVTGPRSPSDGTPAGSIGPPAPG